MATIIIGTSFFATVMLVASSYVLSARSVNQSLAAMLAQEVREWTINLPFIDPDLADQSNPPGPDGTSPNTFVDDLDDLKGWTYSPPRTAEPITVNNKNMVTQSLSSLSNWSQKIDMVWLDPDDLSTTVADGASDIIKVTVTINNGTEDLFQSSWLIIKPGASSS